MSLPILFLSCLALGACLESQPGAARDDDAQQSSSPIQSADSQPSSAPDASTCEALGQDCTTSKACCAGTFCSFDPISYTPNGFCSAPLAEGSYCLAADWCTSGNCRDNVCGSADCVVEGKECQGNWSCCNNQFCSGGPYVYGECHTPRALGEPCQGDDWCQSGLCRDGACATLGCTSIGQGCGGAADCCSGLCDDTHACGWKRSVGEACAGDGDCRSDICRAHVCQDECQATNEGCWWDGDCCAGNYCEYVAGSDSLYSSQCVALHAAGTACSADNMCTSGLCRDGTCQAEGCLANDVECYSSLECCTGACSYTGVSYAAGHCFTPLAAGLACEADAWCASGHCQDGACQ